MLVFYGDTFLVGIIVYLLLYIISICWWIIFYGWKKIKICLPLRQVMSGMSIIWGRWLFSSTSYLKDQGPNPYMFKPDMFTFKSRETKNKDHKDIWRTYTVAFFSSFVGRGRGGIFVLFLVHKRRIFGVEICRRGAFCPPPVFLKKN